MSQIQLMYLKPQQRENSMGDHRKLNLYRPSPLACQTRHIKATPVLAEWDIYSNVFCVTDPKV